MGNLIKHGTQKVKYIGTTLSHATGSHAPSPTRLPLSLGQRKRYNIEIQQIVLEITSRSEPQFCIGDNTVHFKHNYEVKPDAKI